jgi:hypothetical protein
MKKIILISIFVLISSPFAKAQSSNKKPLLLGVTLFAAKSQLPGVLEKVEKELREQRIYWLGYPSFSLSQNLMSCSEDLNCQVRLVLTGEFNDESQMTTIIKNSGADKVDMISNSKNTFYGFAAGITGKNGFLFCEPKKLTKTPKWSDSIEVLLDTGLELELFSAAQKKQWLLDHVNCTTEEINSLGELSQFSLVIDLANSENCPLSWESLKQCFLARGIDSATVNF